MRTRTFRGCPLGGVLIPCGETGRRREHICLVNAVDWDISPAGYDLVAANGGIEMFTVCDTARCG